MEQTKELSLDVAVKGVEPSRAAEIKATFLPMAEMLEKFEKACDMVQADADEGITEDVCHTARRLRLDIKQIRLDVEKNRKAQKERALLEGKAIDGVANIFKHAVVEREDKLKEIETHFERIEEQRVQKLEQERILELSRYGVNNPPPDLGKMDGLVWENFIAGIKIQYDNKKEAERKAEEQRAEEERKNTLFRERRESLLPYSSYGSIDLLTKDTPEHLYKELLEDLKDRKKKDDDEKEKIRLENEKLRKDAEEREAKEAQEKKDKETRADGYVQRLLDNGYVQKAQGVYYLGTYRVDRDNLLSLTEKEFSDRLDETLRLEKERIEKEAELQREKDELEQKRIEEEKKESERLQAIKKEEERLEAEGKAKEDEDARIEAEKAEASRLAAMASDPEKLLKIVESLRLAKEDLSSEEAKSIVSECILKIRDASVRMDDEIQQKA